MKFKAKTKLRIAALVTHELLPPASLEAGCEIEKQPWRTEYDVVSTLKSMGHEVLAVGLQSDLAVSKMHLQNTAPRCIQSP